MDRNTLALALAGIDGMTFRRVAACLSPRAREDLPLLMARHLKKGSVAAMVEAQQVVMKQAAGWEDNGWLWYGEEEGY